MRRSLHTLLLLSFVVSTILSAQANPGRIEGTIRDSTGGALPGVTITLESAALPEKRTTHTDGDGRYVFVNLPFAEYRLTGTLQGFEPFTATVSVTSAQMVIANREMKLGGPAEAMIVTGAAATVNAQSAMGQMIPGVNAQSYMSVNGQSSASNAVMVDGMMVTGIQLAPSDYFGNAPSPQNTEAYDRPRDNTWAEVSRRPLSTFSIDVDTASYANIRRFLNLGQLPPKDAVRIEEMINYFSYDYAGPRGREPFSVTAVIDECPWNRDHRLALVALQARRIEPSRLPPRNLVFLIDVSGSMNEPNKLPLVQSSLQMLTKHLTARDRIGIVVYAGAAGIVLSSTPGDDTETILQAIERLRAGGSTNGSGGIRLAYDVAQQHFIKGGVNRVLLATDGDFNVGVTSRDELSKLIEGKRESGIAISMLGFGMGNLKDATMERLADVGNGNYFYIDSMNEARKVLVDEADGTLVTVAKDVKLQIEFNPAVVQSYRLIGYENRILRARDFNDDRKDAGEMGAGHSVTALYELVPPGRSVDGGIDPLKYQSASTAARTAAIPAGTEAMTVKIRYKEPDGDVSTKIEVPVPYRNTPTSALGFASAVAEFGMVLRDSDAKGTASFNHAIETARRYKGDDSKGHRAEFIRLVETAAGLTPSSRIER